METSKSSVEVHRNWLELPRDITLSVLKKLEVKEILESAQFVCKWWYSLCKDPSLFHTIRIHFQKTVPIYSYNESGELVCHDRSIVKGIKMMYAAVDRANGGSIHLDVEGYCPSEIFSYAIPRLSQLKHLRIPNCIYIKGEVLKEAFEKLPCLEELELTLCFKASKLDLIISSLRSLATFKFNKRGSAYSHRGCDDEALAIAGGMPQLRHLQLIGNDLTNVGLTAILDGCPHLQSLDLRACFQLKIFGNLEKRLSEQIKDLRRPGDSTADYAYDTVDYDYYDDDEYPDTVTYRDSILFDDEYISD